MFGIIHKTTKKYFAGFASNNSPRWTYDASKAWKNSRQMAAIQAGLLWLDSDKKVQRKPVAL